MSDGGSDTSLRAALAELRNAPTLEATIESALRATCAHCGFDRAYLFRVEEAELRIERVHYTHQAAWGDEFVDLARRHRPQLNGHLRETEVIRTGKPLLVPSPATDERTFKPLVLPARTRSYVAAPVMSEDAVVAFLHADLYFTDRDVTPGDRDRLWVFAEGLGLALARATALDRLRGQAAELERLIVSAGETLQGLADAPVRVARDPLHATTFKRSTGLIVSEAGPHRIHSLLTRREFEVIELLNQGASNAAIARELVIAEATVKSHVKHVMRKLRAANRTEAVARYRRIMGEALGNREPPGF